MAKRRVPTVLSDEELEALLAQANPASVVGLRNKAMLKVMAYGGLRVSEVTALRTRDVHRENGRMLLAVRAGKGNRDRRVPLADHVGETLSAWVSRRRGLGVSSDYLFCTVSEGRNVHPVATHGGLSNVERTVSELTPGKPLATRYLQALVPRLAEKAGIEKRVTPHTLRHTAATRLLRAVGDLRRVQKFLGHVSVSTTQVYTHVLVEEVAEAVDLVPDVEARAPAVGAEATSVAEQVLASLPADVRAALRARLGEEV